MSYDYDFMKLFYIFCENLGKFVGKLHAFILNFISYYVILFMKGIQRAEEKYMDILSPIYSKYKNEYKENFFSKNNNIENIVNNV